MDQRPSCSYTEEEHKNAKLNAISKDLLQPHVGTAYAALVSLTSYKPFSVI